MTTSGVMRSASDIRDELQINPQPPFPVTRGNAFSLRVQREQSIRRLKKKKKKNQYREYKINEDDAVTCPISKITAMLND